MLKTFFILSIFLFYTNSIISQQPQQRVAEAVATYQAGNTEDAVQLLQLTIVTYPNFLDAKLVLGQIYLETNRFEEAKTILISAVSMAKENDEVHYALGAAYFNLQDFDNAISEFKKVLKLNPNREQTAELLSLSYLNLGVILYQDDNNKAEAAKYFRQAIKCDNKNIQAYNNLAVLLYEMDQKEETINVIHKALKIKPSEKVLLKILIQIYADSNELEKALSPAKEYYKYYPEDVDGALQLAYLYRFNNQGDKAFGIYEKALQSSPADATIYDDYAELYKFRGMTDDAVNIYTKALKHLSNKSLVYEKIAEVYIYAKMYDKARTAYRNALKTSDNPSYIYEKIADTYITEDNKSKSIQVLKEGIKISSDNWILYSKLGKVLEDSSSLLAVENYQKMVKIDPGNPYSYIRLAMIYHKIDSSESALRNCQKAIQLGTDEPLPYHIQAEIQIDKKDTSNAQENEIISVTKSLKIITDLKSFYFKEIQNSGGRLNYSKMDRMQSDSETMDFTQQLLKQGLGNLLLISAPKLVEKKIIEWQKVYPKNPLLLEYLAKNYERANEIDKALTAYKELVKLDPQVKEGHLGMARIMVTRGKLDGAILAYKRALTIDNKDQSIYENLIFLSRATETLDNLIENFSLLEKREPDNIVLLTNYAKVLRMQSKNGELKRIEEKLEEISLHEARNEKPIFKEQ